METDSAYDPYEFWIDTEYGEEEYWDTPEHTKKADDNEVQNAQALGQKRKRAAPKTQSSIKKRKMSSARDADSSYGQLDPVRFMASKEILSWPSRSPTKHIASHAAALFPDWRKRFANHDGTFRPANMPEAMQRAAQASEQESEEGAGDQELEEEDDERNQHEDDGAEADDDDDAEDGLALDRDTLQTILQQRLGEAGLGGVDQAAFMQAIQKMMAGEDGTNDAADGLVNDLLGKATEGSAVSGWLSGQGVQLDTAEDDEASSVAATDLGESREQQSRPAPMHSSPSDSAVAIPASKRTVAGARSARSGRQAEHMADEASSSTIVAEDAVQTSKAEQSSTANTRAGKRKAATVDDDKPTAKRTRNTRASTRNKK